MRMLPTEPNMDSYYWHIMHLVLYRDIVHIEPLLAQYAPGSLYRDTVHVEPLLAQYALTSFYI